MLNTQKLLYILPDVAYIAEVLPDKKPHSFVIQSFTQINGEFIDDSEFASDKIFKLFAKLEAAEEFHLILPDFFFTTAIVTIKEKSDAKITEELNATVLPQMNLSHDTHLIESAVLNEFRGTSRVQLTALEKAILAPLRVAAAEYQIKTVGISPLSWAIKSLVSLEPSITVLQMGGYLYAAEQYIGVDQTSSASLDEPQGIIEAIKTLKDSEPNIQTVYLLSNSIIEEKLRTALHKTLPIQQMATILDSEEKIPSYVKHCIEYSCKTLSIADYPVPVFTVAKPSKEEVAGYENILAKAKKTGDDEEDEVASSLPKPVTPVGVSHPVHEKVSKDEEASAEATFAEDKAVLEEKSPEEIEAPTEKVVSEKPPEKAELEPSELVKAAVVPPALAVAEQTALAPVVIPTVVAVPDKKLPPAPVETSAITKPEPVAPQVEKVKHEDIDLRQFVQAQSTLESAPVVKPQPTTPPQVKPTIKNKSGVQNMLKMVFITLAVFCLTVGIGVGVGLAILKFSGSSGSGKNPVVEVQTTPTPSATPAEAATPTPSPTPSAAADTKPLNLKVLIVNATTKAGYAGTFKTKIEQAKLGTVTASNAKGKYSGGFLIYLKKSDPAVLKKFADTTGLDLTEDKKAADEDPQAKYDVVIVLAE